MAKEHVHGVFQSIASQYDAANDRISLGMHHFWKQELVGVAVKATEIRLPKQVEAMVPVGMVLDVCCGTGDITERIARTRPDVFVTGLDFSDEMLNVARSRTLGLENVKLVEGNALELPFDDGTFDSAVISFGLRNTPDYEKVLSEMKRVVRNGGTVACLDASVPDDPFIHPFYEVYYKYIMTFLGGGFTKHKEYEWLYQSTEEFLRKDELAALFTLVGLKDVKVKPFMFGAAALHTGRVDW